MYKVLVVDDESAGLEHICTILKKKCQEYEIIGTAENGKRAWEFIKQKQPDILITDIRMPIMDGIELAGMVKKEFPDIISVIVSGYSDFEYAQNAIKCGVSDYLLKPLIPSEMQKLMNDLRKRLDLLYYKKRNSILRGLCNGTQVFQEKDKKYFERGKYFAAIFRRNGRVKRLLGNGQEIFSMEEEKIYIYGRDELESLYLLPEEIMDYASLKKNVENIYEKERKRNGYVTGIVYGKRFELCQLCEVAKRLYRELDKRIIIGKNQLLYINEVMKPYETTKFQDQQKLEYIEELLREKRNQQFLVQLENLFTIWKEGTYTQLYIESSIKYIFRIIYKLYLDRIGFDEVEYLLEEAFYYAESVKEVQDNIIAIAKICLPDLREKINDNQELFGQIKQFIKQNLSKPLTSGIICKEFGLSQATLSRMFRKYEQTSFGAYLTETRINKAKWLMNQEPCAYIRDIAERVGYNDQFYFSRIFRASTGLSPTEYMRENERI